MSNKGSRYQCGQKIGKSGLIKLPEGIHMKCDNAKSWIVQPITKCHVTCDTGTPNYKTVECKQNGWRPTNELICEGVSAGVIIGALIGGLAGVILIAVIYAKYNKRNQKKNAGVGGAAGMRGANINSRRPGRTAADNSADVNIPGYNEPERGTRMQSGRNSQGSHTRQSKPPSYSETGLQAEENQLPSKSSSGNRSQHSKKRGRNYQTEQPQSIHQGYHRSAYEEPAAQPYAPAYNSYYQSNQSNYGYPSAPAEPVVGYGAFAQPGGAYPPSRDYSRPYHVPT